MFCGAFACKNFVLNTHLRVLFIKDYIPLTPEQILNPISNQRHVQNGFTQKINNFVCFCQSPKKKQASANTMRFNMDTSATK
jgi:hypothetical protein